MTEQHEIDGAVSTGRRWSVIWLPGLAVAIGAAVATAHGLYEVAVASRVPNVIAWLYPLITDGLALVAYTATARLTGSAARYAWAVVVVAAGLSGLAQAAFLAGDSGALSAPPWLRFVIGAWPAIAAAVVAHLLYLLAEPGRERVADSRKPSAGSEPAGVQRSTLAVQPERGEQLSGPVQASELGSGADSPAAVVGAQRSGAGRPSGGPDEQVVAGGPLPRAVPAPSPARDRAQDHALAHHAAHQTWPTVTELQDTAGVSRGTAAAVLKALRDATDADPSTGTAPIPLHLIRNTTPPAPYERFTENDKKTQP